MIRPTTPLRTTARLAALVVIVGALVLGASAPAQAQTTAAGPDGGGGNNIVMLQNRVDGRLTTRSEIQLNRVPGPTAGPVNLASAYSSCVDCQSLAVALQIDLISRTATRITPQNAAVAVNSGCTRCYTVARAFQYVLQVDDPATVPPDVTQLIQAMDRELNAIQADRTITLYQAESRINAVVAQFSELAQSLDERRDMQVTDASPRLDPATTPMPTPSPTQPAATAAPASASVTPTPASTGAPLPAATAAATTTLPTATPAATTMPPTPTATTMPPTSTAPPTASPVRTMTPTPVPSATPVLTAARSPIPRR